MASCGVSLAAARPSETRELHLREGGTLPEGAGSKRNEMTGGRSKLHDEEPCDFYSSPNIIRIMKARRMRCM
jgi:hypothetical protein